jgi:hypothetical protein
MLGDMTTFAQAVSATSRLPSPAATFGPDRDRVGPTPAAGAASPARSGDDHDPNPERCAVQLATAHTDMRKGFDGAGAAR